MVLNLGLLGFQRLILGKGIALVLFAMLFQFLPRNVYAQVYPIQVNSVLNQPTTAFIADYSAAGSNKWQNTIILKDNTVGSIGVKLRISIESGSLSIRTKPNYFPSQPITLVSGIPTVLSGFDIANYFNYNNLDFVGISRQQIQQNGKLPEGFYTFCVEVLEFNTSKIISRKTCASTYIQLKDQPLIINPQCGSPIVPSSGQNIVFQWQNSGPVSPDPANQNQYRLKILEVTDPLIDPFLAINNNKIFQVFETNLSPQTNYTYTIADPILDLGKRYVFTVQAEDARGTASFKNEGLSEICWFSYGYPEGGLVEITKPENGHKFIKGEPLIFKWSEISNPVNGQMLKYQLKVVEKNSGQSLGQAIANNNVVKEWESSSLSATSSFEHMLDSLPKGKNYVWQISAISGVQTVAKSAPHEFTTPPFIDEIKAGNQTLLITSLENSNVNSLKGSGKLKWIKGEDTTLVALEFEALKVIQTAGRYVLEDGEILANSEVDTLKLTSLNELVPHGVFHIEKLRLNKDGLYIKGQAKIPLPLAVNSGNAAFLSTESEWINYNSYTLKGGLKANESNTFTLLDPYSFEVNYNNTSDVIINDNKFVLKLNGKVSLHEGVKTIEDKAVEINFFDHNNFSYNTIDYIQETHIRPIPNTKIKWQLKKVVLDFSETESPGSKQSEADWMGVYVEEADLIFPTDFDKSEQLYGVENLQFPAGISESTINQANIDGTGLNLDVNLEDLDVIYLHTFGSLWDKIAFKVKENSLESGSIEVSFALPLLSESEIYTATLPISDVGFEKAYLPSDFAGVIVFDEDNEERKTDLIVLAGRFDEYGLLDLDINVKNQHLDLELKNINHFKLDGFDNFGFGGIGKAYVLETPITFRLGDLRFNLLALRVGKHFQFSGIGFEVQAHMGATVSGIDGAAITTMSAKKQSPDLEGKAAATRQLTNQVQPADAPTAQSEKMDDEQTVKNLKILSEGASSDYTGVVNNDEGFAFGFDLRIDVGVGYFFGYLQYQHSNEFGNSMYVLGGGVETDMKYMLGLPVDEVKGQAIVGMHFAENGAPKPIILIRAVIGVTFISVPPLLQWSNFGFAVGTFVAPEDFLPDDFTPATEMRWHIDLNTPFALYLSARLTDDAKIPGINVGAAGIVYIFTIAGGFRIDASDNLDFDSPSSLSNLQVCGTYSETREIINMAAIPIAGPLANKFVTSLGGITASMMFVAGGVDLCLGKVIYVRGKGLLTGITVMPSLPIPFCSSQPALTTFGIDFSNLDDPTKFELTQTFGSRESPSEIYFACNPVLRLGLKYWTSTGMKDGAFYTTTGASFGLNTDLSIGLNLGFASAKAVFKLKAELSAEASVKLDFKSFSKEAKANGEKQQVEFLASLNARAEFLAHAYLNYKFGFLNKDETLTLGYVYLLADGVFRITENGVFLDGTYEATFRALNKEYSLKDSQELKIS